VLFPHRLCPGARGLFEHPPALVIALEPIRHGLFGLERAKKVIDAVGERHLQRDPALCPSVQPESEGKPVAARCVITQP
jgi:hypothetical protein